MAMQEQINVGAKVDEVSDRSSYEKLLDLVDLKPVKSTIELTEFKEHSNLAQISAEERLTAAIRVFLELSSGNHVNKIDKSLIDSYIAKLDADISAQLDLIMHHEQFQKVESSWRSLEHLVERLPLNANVKLQILDVDKESLRDDFQDSTDTTQSVLYKHVYTDEYDTPGGEPISSIISDFEFDSTVADVNLLSEISRVAAAAHCPFVGSAGAAFFNKDSFEEVIKIEDIDAYMQRAEFLHWQNFRKKEDSRYVGLTLPRFLLRLPYGEANPIRNFNYSESVSAETHDKFLWGNASFVFASNVAKSFHENGWSVNIRGPKSGGTVQGLPVHVYGLGGDADPKIPTEVLISETRELGLADQGFIPLSYYKNSDYACFFSANSTQQPSEFETDEATATARINARLPYIFLVSRIAHYLKVLQREKIGSSTPRHQLEKELNVWLNDLVTEMKDPDAEVIARRPLKEANVKVSQIPNNPGFYRITTCIVPHFQVEGVDVELSLMGQMPGES